MYIFFSAIFAAIGLLILTLKLPENLMQIRMPKLISGSIFLYLAVWSFGTRAIDYNDSGNCTHIRTAFGAESSKCDIGWYFLGWGKATTFPHFITIVNDTSIGVQNAFSEKDYRIRMRDHWAARVSQTTRFKLPVDEKRFLFLAKSYNSAEELSKALLRPAVDASLDVVASEVSLDDYYLNHKRNEFRRKFFETIRNGFDNTKIAAKQDPKRGMGILPKETDVKIKKFKPHKYSKYGISVNTVELHHFRPDSDYTNQLKERKAASMKRTLMIEKRMSEEQELRLAKARQQIEVSNRSTQALVEKARITALAEARMKVSLMEVEMEVKKAEAGILISEKGLEKARIEAEVDKIKAQSAAYAQKVTLSGKTEFDKRLEAYIETNRMWAEAIANKVPLSDALIDAQTNENPIQQASAFMDQLATGALPVPESNANLPAKEETGE